MDSNEEVAYESNGSSSVLSNSTDAQNQVPQSDGIASGSFSGVGNFQTSPKKQNQAANQGTNVDAPSYDWMPQAAEDSDLIEKEWVDKAKEVVERTSGDPFKKNNELNKIKADYLKKRYNKILSSSD